MFDELVNKLITNVEMPDETTLIFYTNEEKFTYEAFADCCSESWIESISDKSSIINSTISKINIKTQTLDGTRQEEDEVDFVTMITNKGYFDIEFRNSSNGYYGGTMDLIKRQKL